MLPHQPCLPTNGCALLRGLLPALPALLCQSKGTVAKTLRKLEDKGYIERIINKDNRQKYILKLTKKGDELIPVLKREADHWHNAVGLAEVSEETMDVIRAVARKSYNLVNE